MSQKLVKQLADAGLSSLQAVLEHLGILTFSCALGRTCMAKLVTAEKLDEPRQNASFGRSSSFGNRNE